MQNTKNTGQGPNTQFISTDLDSVGNRILGDIEQLNNAAYTEIEKTIEAIPKSFTPSYFMNELFSLARGKRVWKDYGEEEKERLTTFIIYMNARFSIEHDIYNEMQDAERRYNAYINLEKA